MTPERHARAEEIFQAALERPRRQRNEFLDQACAGDTDLRAYLQQLIDACTLTSTESTDGDTRPTLTLCVKECPHCKRCYDQAIAVCPADRQLLRLAFPGSLLIDGKYSIERFIGRGGMGAVYLVNHVHLDKRFALKLISAGGPISEHRRRNFQVEARLLAQLQHPHIVDVTDSGIDPREEGMPYLVMEYLEGQTVEQRLADRHGPMPYPEAIHLLRQAAAGIDAAHAKEIVHGDLKPANLFLARDAGRGEVLNIVDFGLARLAAPGDGQRTAGIRGTPAYMAHEMFQGAPASKASDRYALGAIAYELLTGDLPFGWQIDGIRENQKKPPLAPSVRNPNLPPELDAAILALLDPAPAQRPSGAVAAVAAIDEAWLAAERRQWRKRETPRRAGFAAAGAVAAVFVAGAAALSTAGRMLEGWTVDARFAVVPPHPPDRRLLVVVLDEASLRQDPPRALAQWDTDFAQMIDRAFRGGAQAVAIDNLLPVQWSLSPEFGSAVAAHLDRLALAMSSEPDGSVTGPECISPLIAVALGPERVAAAFGYVNLDPDPDGVVRRPRIGFLDRDGHDRPAFAARAVAAAWGHRIASLGNRREWVDYSVRPSAIPQISWKDAAASSPDLFQNRLVLIGEATAGSNDGHPVPPAASPNPVPGIFIQALIANTILAGFPVRDFSLLRSMAAVAAPCFAIFLLALRLPHRPALAFAAAGLALCLYALLAFALFRAAKVLLALTGPELAIILSALSAWYWKSRLQPYPAPAPGAGSPPPPPGAPSGPGL